MATFAASDSSRLCGSSDELQALVFEAGGQTFAINVAKLDELIMPPQTRRWPGQHAAVLGAFNLRQHNIALVDLGYYVRPQAGLTEDGSTVVITNFNGHRTAFLVKAVHQIESVDWANVSPPAGRTGGEGLVTGIMKLGEQMIPLLDFEAIHDEIAGAAEEPIEVPLSAASDVRMMARLAYVEDSSYMRNTVLDLLRRAGFDQIEVFEDGQQALDALRERSGAARPQLLLTDIEMPRLDGLNLTRLLKQSGRYDDVPIVLFSSIVNQASRHSGLRAGADAQLNKGDLPQLLPTLDRLLGLDTVSDSPADGA